MILSFLLLLLSGGTVDTVGSKWIDCQNIVRVIVIGKPDTTINDEDREEK